MRETISMDLRRRILKAYDSGQHTRQQVAERFDVSLGMVKKLLQQRRRIGEIRPQHHRSGRKPGAVASESKRMRELLNNKPDMTLAELRSALGLDCSLPAIHYVLVKMGLSYKKKRSGPASKTGRTSRGRAAGGGGAKEVLTRRG